MLPQVRSLNRETSVAGEETFETLIAGKRCRLEHIVSRGESSPDEFWYDQNEIEWVALLSGNAVLEFDEGELSLSKGDYLVIDAHLRHRVKEVSVDAVWLALHLEPE